MTEEKQPTPMNQRMMRYRKNRYADGLHAVLEKHPALRIALTQQYHEKMTAKQLIHLYTLNEDNTVRDVLYSPFVQAWLETEQLETDVFQDEIEIITMWLSNPEVLEMKIQEVEELAAFIKSKMQFFLGGYLQYVSVYEEIPLLPKKEGQRRRDEGAKKFREENPELVAENLRRMQEKGWEATTGTTPVYSEAVVSAIQGYFDQGKSYKETADLLNRDFKLTGKKRFNVRRLIQAVRTIEGLHYTVQENIEKERQAFKEELKRVFHETKSVQKTLEHFAGRYEEGKIKSWLHKLGLRERIDWRKKSIQGDDGDLSLLEILEKFLQSKPESDMATMQTHQEFLDYLKSAFSLELSLSFGAFHKKAAKMRDRE